MKGKPQSFLRHREHVCQPFSSIAMSTYPNTLESVLGPNLDSILLEMKDKFPPVNPHPKEEISTIMYKAGQRSVVDWLENRLSEDN